MGNLVLNFSLPTNTSFEVLFFLLSLWLHFRLEVYLSDFYLEMMTIRQNWENGDQINHKRPKSSRFPEELLLSNNGCFECKRWVTYRFLYAMRHNDANNMTPTRLLYTSFSDLGENRQFSKKCLKYSWLQKSRLYLSSFG